MNSQLDLYRPCPLFTHWSRAKDSNQLFPPKPTWSSFVQGTWLTKRTVGLTAISRVMNNEQIGAAFARLRFDVPFSCLSKNRFRFVNARMEIKKPHHNVDNCTRIGLGSRLFQRTDRVVDDLLHKLARKRFKRHFLLG